MLSTRAIPRSLSLSSAIVSDLLEVEGFRSLNITLLSRGAKELSLLRWRAAIESIGSSCRLEGSIMRDAAVEQHFLSSTPPARLNYNEQTITGYHDVLNRILTTGYAMQLTESLVLELHRDLLAHCQKDEKLRGHYKTKISTVFARDVNGRTTDIPMPCVMPIEARQMLCNLIDETRTLLDQKREPAIIVIAAFVVRFLWIRPFHDGNGRLVRLLTTLLLLRAGYEFLAYTSLEHVFESAQIRYYQALQRTQLTFSTDTPDWTPWFAFFCDALVKAGRRLENQLEAPTVVEEPML